MKKYNWEDLSRAEKRALSEAGHRPRQGKHAARPAAENSASAPPAGPSEEVVPEWQDSFAQLDPLEGGETLWSEEDADPTLPTSAETLDAVFAQSNPPAEDAAPRETPAPSLFSRVGRDLSRRVKDLKLPKPLELLRPDFSEEQPYTPSDSTARPSLPSEDEVRAYVAQYAETGYHFRPEDAEAAENDFVFTPEEATPLAYDGSPLDTAPEDNYRPRTYSVYSESDVLSEPKESIFSRRKKTAEPTAPDPEEAMSFSDSYRDYGAAPVSDAQPDEFDHLEPDAPISAEKEFTPTSFREYLTSFVVTFLYRIRKGRESTATVTEDEDDLGEEVKPRHAYEYYRAQLPFLGKRLCFAGVLLFFLCWIALGFPVPGMLKNVRVLTLFSLALQLTVMLCCLDTVTGGILNMTRRCLGLDSMAVISCLMTSLDALISLAGDGENAHLALCALSSLSLTGVTLASYLSCSALKLAALVPTRAKFIYNATSVVGEDGITVVKALRPASGFVRRCEEAPLDEELFRRVSPFLLALAGLLGLIAAVACHGISYTVYLISAILAPAVPAAGLLCCALPFYVGSDRIRPSGAAIAGWSGLRDLGTCRSVLVSDRDLFPEGSVTIVETLVASLRPQDVIAYAGSMLAAGGVGTACCFADLMQKNGIVPKKIENFEVLPGGGLRGIIDSSVILCGSYEFMHLMNVNVPERFMSDRPVLLAVDGILYGVFRMKYTPDEKVRRALRRLVRSSRHPIFAPRDFNLTPGMLRDCFAVSTEGYDFMPYPDRFLSKEAVPDEKSPVCALVCRDGLAPYAAMLSTGESMYRISRISTYATLALAVFGMLLVFFKFLTVGTVSSAFLLLYMLLCALPVLLASFFLN